MISRFIDKTDWRHSISPEKKRWIPVHSWFLLNHSYGKELVSNIISEIQIEESARILDPFCGSGTTPLVCKERNIQSVGIDLMPLSILVSRTKCNDYNPSKLNIFLDQIISKKNKRQNYPLPDISIIKRAFTPLAWQSIQSLVQTIREICRGKYRDFFITSLLSIVKDFGAYSNDGGFPRLTSKPKYPVGHLSKSFYDRSARMIVDVGQYPIKSSKLPIILSADSRFILPRFRKFDAIICSPPYPNRHDYSRVYAVELGAVFYKSNNELKRLRKSIFRSHIEVLPDDANYIVDKLGILKEVLNSVLTNPRSDRRLYNMLLAYFQDVELMLKNMWRALKPDATAVVVLGNVRFAGMVIPVDEIVASISNEIGFYDQQIYIVRFRGNSPQQMRDYGRIPIRESILFLRKGQRR